MMYFSAWLSIMKRYICKFIFNWFIGFCSIQSSYAVPDFLYCSGYLIFKTIHFEYIMPSATNTSKGPLSLCNTKIMLETTCNVIWVERAKNKIDNHFFYWSPKLVRHNYTITKNISWSFCFFDEVFLFLRRVYYL